MPSGQQAQVQQPTLEPMELDLSDDGGEETAPPAEYFVTCRSLFPASTRRDALRAWDQTNGVGGGGAGQGDWGMDSARVQAALGALVDLCSVDEATLPSSSPSTGKRPRSPSPLPFQPLFRDERSSSPPLEVLVSPRAKRARTSLAGEPSGVEGKRDGKGKGKGKGKATEKTELLLLSSDVEGNAAGTQQYDEVGDSSIEILTPVKRTKGKGKARAYSPSPLRPSSVTRPKGAGVLDLSSAVSDSDLEDDPLIVEPSTSRGLHFPRGKAQRRLPSPAAVAIPAIPSPPPSPFSQILAVLPDVLPSAAREMLDSDAVGGDAERAVEALFSLEGGYPKIPDEAAKAVKEPEWADLEARKRDGPPGVLYTRMALDHLYASFPFLPTPLIKSTYVSPTASASYLAPAYLILHAGAEKGEYDAQKLKKPRNAPKKVVRTVKKARTGQAGAEEETEEEEAISDELRREIQWIEAKLTKDRLAALKEKHEAAAAAREASRIERANERARKAGEAVECGCCFDEVAVENTAPCDAGHLFCKTCCTRNANTRLGQRQATLPCMAPDCASLFSPQGWAEYLPQKTIDGLEKLAQEQDVGKAFEGVEGFEGCPFCPYACFIENPHERLFHCQRADCGKVSCRKCKEHMNCSQCHAHWCDICRKLIPEGYAHFSAAGCPQFDDTAMRNFNEVEAARRAAETQLDEKTRADAAKLAAEAPVRGQPRYPNPPVAAARAPLPQQAGAPPGQPGAVQHAAFFGLGGGLVPGGGAAGDPWAALHNALFGFGQALRVFPPQAAPVQPPPPQAPQETPAQRRARLAAAARRGRGRR
ncbi:hypothetical protein JCM10213v2_008929 [Rhodosporidiobolus nylandii]